MEERTPPTSNGEKCSPAFGSALLKVSPEARKVEKVRKKTARDVIGAVSLLILKTPLQFCPFVSETPLDGAIQRIDDSQFVVVSQSSEPDFHHAV